MSKNRIIMLVGVAVVVIGLGLLAYSMNKNKGYSVVYVTTGEVYVGTLSTFPDFKLDNGYIFQVIKDEKDPTQNTFQLQPVSEALWAPQTMHFNRKNVVFYGPLLATSKIAETIAAQAK